MFHKNTHIRSCLCWCKWQVLLELWIHFYQYTHCRICEYRSPKCGCSTPRYTIWGTRWPSSFRHCVTNRMVAGSIPDGVIGIFH
jgi:hypothetical protein